MKATRLIQAGSRSLAPAESRYAVSELECLAIFYAIIKCRHFLLGANFTVVTDHRPLKGVFKKGLEDITNARLRGFREKLAPYSFKVTWVPGKSHLIADALSRYPVFPPPEEEAEDTDEDEDKIVAGASLCRAISEDSAIRGRSLGRGIRSCKEGSIGGKASQLFLHRRQRGRLPTLPAATAVDFETSQEGSAIRKPERAGTYDLYF
jgi:hypothetical protein